MEPQLAAVLEEPQLAAVLEELRLAAGLEQMTAVSLGWVPGPSAEQRRWQGLWLLCRAFAPGTVLRPNISAATRRNTTLQWQPPRLRSGSRPKKTRKTTPRGTPPT